jgi:hypothetical protein
VGRTLAGPVAIVRDGWRMAEDGPAFLRDLVDAIKGKQTIDPKRVFNKSAWAFLRDKKLDRDPQFQDYVIMRRPSLGKSFQRTMHHAAEARAPIASRRHPAIGSRVPDPRSQIRAFAILFGCAIPS